MTATTILALTALRFLALAVLVGVLTALIACAVEPTDRSLW